MKYFNKFSKIIAIKDAPIVNSSQQYAFTGITGDIQAFKTGDVFEVISTFAGVIIVYHPKFKIQMAVDSDKFELLENHRNNKLNQILNNDNETYT